MFSLFPKKQKDERTKRVIEQLRRTEFGIALEYFRLDVDMAIKAGRNGSIFCACEDEGIQEERTIALNRVAYELEKKGYYVLKNTNMFIKLKWRNDRPWRWYEKLWYKI